jgi:hypothetical protein
MQSANAGARKEGVALLHKYIAGEAAMELGNGV